MITVDATELVRAINTLYKIPNGVDRAARSAVNKTARGVRTDVKNEVRDRYEIKAGDVLKSMSVQFASQGDLSAIIKSKGRPIALSKFKVKPKTVQRRGSKNRKISVSVKKGSERMLNRAFVAQFDSGHKGVVERVSKKRFPVKELFGPSIPQMASSKDVSKNVNKLAEERLKKNFNSEVNRILKGYGK